MNNYESIPEHMKQALISYVEKGIPLGSFLEAVVCNDFMGACCRADDINKHILFDYSMFVYNKMPWGCHGSKERYKKWLQEKQNQGENHG